MKAENKMHRNVLGLGFLLAICTLKKYKGRYSESEQGGWQGTALPTSVSLSNGA